MHESQIILRPDISYNQYNQFLPDKLFPKIEAAYKGDVELYLIEGIIGENSDNWGWIFLLKSAEARDKWIDEEGGIKEALREEFFKVIE